MSLLFRHHDSVMKKSNVNEGKNGKYIDLYLGFTQTVSEGVKEL